MSFHENQLVVCVDDSADASGRRHLTKGVVYTVAEHPRYYVRLVEMVAQNEHDGWWRPERFRPLDETRLDIFRQMLVSQPKVEEPSPVVFSDQEPS